MFRKLMLPLLAIALVFGAIGCSNTGTESQVADQIDFNDEFAGLAATDEAVGFGDPDLIATEEDEVEVADPMAVSAEIAAIESDPASTRPTPLRPVGTGRSKSPAAPC